jgi:terminase small subunit-like protein
VIDLGTRPVIKARERLLLRHLLAGAKGVRGNARRAAIAAGYRDSRYLDDQLRRIFRRPSIRTAIAEALERWDITQERVLAEYARIAYANIAEVVERDPNTGDLVLRDTLDNLGAEVTSSIAEIRYTRTPRGGPTVTVRMHDKLAALGILGRFLGLTRTPEISVILVQLMANLNLRVLSTDEMHTFRELLVKAMPGHVARD